MVDMGCTTIATLAHAVGDPDQLDAFIQHIILVPEVESFQQFTPQGLFAPCSALDSGRPAPSDVPMGIPPRRGLTAAEVKEIEAAVLPELSR